MRSRYAAYVLGRSDHVFRTWHPRTRPDDVDPDRRHDLARAGGAADLERAAPATTAAGGVRRPVRRAARRADAARDQPVRAARRTLGLRRRGRPVTRRAAHRAAGAARSGGGGPGAVRGDERRPRGDGALPARLTRAESDAFVDRIEQHFADARVRALGGRGGRSVRRLHRPVGAPLPRRLDGSARSSRWSRSAGGCSRSAWGRGYATEAARGRACASRSRSSAARRSCRSPSSATAGRGGHGAARACSYLTAYDHPIEGGPALPSVCYLLAQRGTTYPGRRDERRPATEPVYLDHAASTPMYAEAVAAMTRAAHQHRQPVVAARGRPVRPPGRRGVAGAHRRRAQRPPRRGRVHLRRHRVRQPRGEGPLLGPPRRRPAAHPHPVHRRRAPRRARPAALARRARGRRGRAAARSTTSAGSTSTRSATPSSATPARSPWSR